MAGTLIDIPAADSGAFKAYLALPAAKKGPGIVLIQEVFGVNHHIRAVADSYAADGFHCDERGSCNAAAAKLARERSIAFLKKTVA